MRQRDLMSSLSSHLAMNAGRESEEDNAPHPASARSNLNARGARLIELENWSALLELELTSAQSSRAVRTAVAIRTGLNAIAPERTFRGAAARLTIKALRKARQGPRAFVSSAIRRAWRSGPAAAISRAIALRRHRPKRADTAVMNCVGVEGLVSVVLPVYNQAHLLAESIESVLDQVYTQFELIVVNDGSTDDVESVLDRYIADPRVRVLDQPNLTLPKALSNGFSFAQGEFWTWTSADNLMDPNQLGRFVAFLRSHPEVGMVYADYLAINEFGEPLEDPDFRPRDRKPSASASIHLPRDPRAINAVPDNFIGPCFLYRGTVGRLIGEYDPNLGLEDYDYWMRVNHAFVIEHLGSDDMLYRYRVHRASLSGRAGELRIAERVKALMQYERERQTFLRKTFLLVVDTAFEKMVNLDDPRIHAKVRLESALEPRTECLTSLEKILYLMESSSLAVIAGRGLANGSVVAVWYESIDEVYLRRAEAERFRIVAFTSDHAVAERLKLFGTTVFVLDKVGKMLDLSVRYANNRVYYENTRPAATRERHLPRARRRANQPHILMQLDDFDRGGLENVVLALARGLRQRGMKVSILALGKQGPAAEEARASGFSIWTLPAASREYAYERLLRQQSIDLVQAHYSTFGAAVASRVAVPFVQVVHNTYVWLDARTIEAYRRADQDTTATICVSAEAARYCDQRLRLSASKIIVIPNGIDGQRLDDARHQPSRTLRDELGLGTEDFVLLNVASIHATKAQTVLVRAFAEVVRAQPSARLVIVGSASDPTYEARLRRTILQLGLGRKVVLAGQRSDVGRFYWMADAFTLPSYWEGWSLALTEAVYTGLPVVATDVGGARDLLSPECGFLVKPPFDPVITPHSRSLAELVGHEEPAFVDELARALTMTCQASQRSSVSEDRKQRLGVEHMVERHAAVVDWLLQGGDPAAARVWIGTNQEPTASVIGSLNTCFAE